VEYCEYNKLSNAVSPMKRVLGCSIRTSLWVNAYYEDKYMFQGGQHTSLGFGATNREPGRAVDESLIVLLWIL
jgi:hypothetical protein